MATTTEPETKGLQPIQLRTAHDHTLVVQAIEHRCDDLEKLAKKNDEGGYPREARVQKADVGALRQFILPQFRAQQELPLATTEQVRAGIANSLRDVIHNSLVVRAPEDKQESALQTREEALLEKLAIRIESFAAAIAEEGYAAGMAARESAPEAIALRSIHALTVFGL